MQNPSGRSLLVRTSMDDPLEVTGPIRAAVGRVEKNVPIYGATTLENRLEAYLTPRRISAPGSLQLRS